MAMPARSSRALTAVLLGCLLAAAARCPSATAQRAESRANGDGDPAFVGDAQTGQDLVESGFLDQPKQPEVSRHRERAERASKNKRQTPQHLRRRRRFWASAGAATAAGPCPSQRLVALVPIPTTAGGLWC